MNVEQSQSQKKVNIANMAKSKTTKLPCDICVDLHVLIKCKCGLDACQGCIRQYLLESINDPMCMGCKIPYTYDFINTHLGKTWHSGEYKKSRKAVLLDRELAKAPLAMEYIEQRDTADRLDAQLKYTREQQAAKKLAMEQAKEDYENTCREVRLTKRDLLTARRLEKGAGVRQGGHATSDQRLYSKCPSENCPGMLNGQHVCVTCGVHTCNLCCEIKDGDGKEHKCDPNTLETIKLLRADTKPCPKCKTPIHKIEGCYQMWCTKCHTTFHYRTLEILKETIHNPHYTEWAANNIAVEREGNACDAEEDPVRRIARAFRDDNKVIAGRCHNAIARRICLEIQRFHAHAERVVLPSIATRLAHASDDPQTVRVRLAKHLQGMMPVSRLQTALFSSSKQRQRWADMQALWTMCVNSLQALVEMAIINHDIELLVDQTKQLVDYMNEKADRISKIYGNKTQFKIHFVINREREERRSTTTVVTSVLLRTSHND